MTYWRNWDDILMVSLRELGTKLANILPNIVGAIVILIIGWIIASALGSLVSRLLGSVGIDKLTQSSPAGQQINKTGMRFVPSRLIGWAVKWFFILATLITASNVLGWAQITDFLNAIALYIPNVIIAIVILVIGFIVSNFVGNIVSVSLARSALAPYQKTFLMTGSRAAIIVFAVMASMIQLKIAATLIQTLFTGIIFAVSLAVGLAFGLGGREQASEFLRRHTKPGGQ